MPTSFVIPLLVGITIALLFHLIPGMVGLYFSYCLIRGNYDKSLPIALPIVISIGLVLTSIGAFFFSAGSF